MQTSKEQKSILIFIKYIVVGALAAAAELSLLHYLTEEKVMWYIHASALASILSFIIGFALRKLWVFRDQRWNNITKQLGLYLASLLLVVGVNTLLVSFLVEHFKVQYLIAQFSAGVVTGLIGFVINNKFTFNIKHTPIL